MIYIHTYIYLYILVSNSNENIKKVVFLMKKWENNTNKYKLFFQDNFISKTLDTTRNIADFSRRIEFDFKLNVAGSLSTHYFLKSDITNIRTNYIINL